jgi:hypothetical protein
MNTGSSVRPLFDDDDHYGDADRSWPSVATLDAGTGPYTLSFCKVDTGWFDDGDGFDVRLALPSA